MDKMNYMNDAASTFSHAMAFCSEADCLYYITTDPDFKNIGVNNRNYFKNIRVNNRNLADSLSFYMPIALNRGTRFVDLLIDYGANINMPSDAGLTPLMQACMRKNENIALKLINMNCDIYLHDHHKLTALTYACMFNMPAVAIVLAQRHLISGSEITIHDVTDGCDNIVHQYIINKYKETILSAIDDVDSIIGRCFTKTYAVGVIDIVCEFII
ncbi:MAG: hypothetical protein Faunusvirus1_26 [Faunusvirus sp.]|jgi:ankyrin repeat protein|uniref:Uncharacterized protein n=1 Tax=Faunusvirus sp. TaxID=2487766 RepID=A0A3G4ZVU8_9VIRU|nr:MAG: hypothetical protein Faunusvirus1_26 [Faunusvirus sp.]